MASIQQSFNQMLMSAQIGAGLYAHSPAAKQKQEIKNLEKQSQAIEKARDIQIEADVDTPEANALYQENLEQGSRIAQRLFELDPSKQRYENVRAEREGKEEFEQIMEQRVTRRLQTLKNQKEQLELRKKLLAGEPEVKPTKKSEVIKYGE
jgi:hypothetical protein